MSIEPSTVILTIISFCVLMAVLHCVLFKPILKLMHDRREKIENSIAVKTKSAEKLEEHNRLISSRLDEALKNEREASAKRIREAGTESAEEKKRAQETENARLEQIKKELAEEMQKMEKNFDSRLPEFARTLADRLVSKDY